jgi:hypothetical protein
LAGNYAKANQLYDYDIQVQQAFFHHTTASRKSPGVENNVTVQFRVVTVNNIHTPKHHHHTCFAAVCWHNQIGNKIGPRFMLWAPGMELNNKLDSRFPGKNKLDSRLP